MTSPPKKPPIAPRGALPETRLTGTVEGVTYQHPGSLYTVLRLSLGPDSEPPGELFAGRGPRERIVHAVGKAGEIEEGGRVALRGEWRVHPKHVPQFHFQVLESLRDLGGVVGVSGVAGDVHDQGHRVGVDDIFE